MQLKRLDSGKVTCKCTYKCNRDGCQCMAFLHLNCWFCHLFLSFEYPRYHCELVSSTRDYLLFIDKMIAIYTNDLTKHKWYVVDTDIIIAPLLKD